GLAVILVGNDPASEVYVAAKGHRTIAMGMRSFEHRLPAETSELELLRGLNSDPTVDGILVQLPLPPHIAAERIADAIDAAKDVDGFHPDNAGRLMPGLPNLIPCTPLGAMLLLSNVRSSLSGLHAVVVRPFEHRRKADRAPAASEQLHGNNHAFTHPQ